MACNVNTKFTDAIMKSSLHYVGELSASLRILNIGACSIRTAFFVLLEISYKYLYTNYDNLSDVEKKNCHDLINNITNLKTYLERIPRNYLELREKSQLNSSCRIIQLLEINDKNHSIFLSKKYPLETKEYNQHLPSKKLTTEANVADVLDHIIFILNKFVRVFWNFV